MAKSNLSALDDATPALPAFSAIPPNAEFLNVAFILDSALPLTVLLAIEFPLASFVAMNPSSPFFIRFSFLY